ncbi:carbon-nitrogen hydrolase family protein [Oceaniglobus ichthyenteri]|uniref:carbon-nitrogen hydrolase family protein n=1 Tax=Oceaniglobus ichthyenteri TaxID=2136177 RepID=UPI001F0C5D11|nr:carbon-nitrogen hydrolase family protein [Oceaniglobus ichthyenteri]
MAGVLKLCMAQMTSANCHAPNIAFMRDAAARAGDAGCDILALPEMAGLCNRDFATAKTQVVAAQDDPFIAACRDAAARHGLWINTGSTPVLGQDGKFLNHGCLIDATGAIAARYDKIHLFDVFLKGKRPSGESDHFAPGTHGTVANTPWGAMGLSICYDLRFAHLYRAYGQVGANVIFVPSSFMVATGEAHWHVLLRARAIENGCFIVAPAQVGYHADGRRTFGHSLVVSPWGEVMCDMGNDGPGTAIVDLDLEQVAKVRGQIPSLRHDRTFDMVTTERAEND